MSNLYIDGFSNHEKYRKRMDSLVYTRNQALLFVTATVLLSLGINVLASVLFEYLPKWISIPLLVVVLLIVITSSYLALWGRVDHKDGVAILLISVRAPNNWNTIKEALALVSGTGWGVSNEISKKLIEKKGGVITEDDVDQIEHLTIETVVFSLMAHGYRDAWYFPGTPTENLNTRWIPGDEPLSSTAEIDFSTILKSHPILELHNKCRPFKVPEGTTLVIERDVNRRRTLISLENKFVGVHCVLEWNGTGLNDLAHESAWVPREEGNYQVSYLLNITIKYKWRAKLPFSRHAFEYMCWAERFAEYMLSELSFRSFEDDRNRIWRKKEVEAVERFLGTSRWRFGS